jgi:hypothetical protein
VVLAARNARAIRSSDTTTRRPEAAFQPRDTLGRVDRQAFAPKSHYDGKSQ